MSQLQNLELPSGIDALDAPGRYGEDIYKHSAGENCASDISRLGVMVGMDSIAPAAIIYPITMLAVYKRNECHVCVNNGTKETNPNFSSTG